MGTTAIAEFRGLTQVRAQVLATVAIPLLKAREVLIVILAQVLQLAQEHIITTITLPTLRVLVIPEIQAAEEHTLVVVVTINLVKHALELDIT